LVISLFARNFAGWRPQFCGLGSCGSPAEVGEQERLRAQVCALAQTGKPQICGLEEKENASNKKEKRKIKGWGTGKKKKKKKKKIKNKEVKKKGGLLNEGFFHDSLC